MAIQEICDEKKCTGCMLCSVVCPQNAIESTLNEIGCQVPQVVEDKCISCGLCMRMCPVDKKQELCKPVACYAAQYQKQEIDQSSSGGVFQALAKAVLRESGVVIGAAWTKDAKGYITGLDHILVEDISYLQEVLGSKYVQSSIYNVLPQVKEALLNGKTVLFSGTPCQVAAVNQYIPQKLKENLITMDIICHGVCGFGFFDSFQSKQRLGKFKNFTFRDKSQGWGLHCSYEQEKNGRSIFGKSPCDFVSYYSIFIRAHMYRESCYSCSYTKEERGSDITVGDYWGISEELPEYASAYNVKKGVSSVLVNSEKGKLWINKLDDLAIQESSFEKIAKHNEQLMRPSLVGKYRDEYKIQLAKGYSQVNSFFLRHEFDWIRYAKFKMIELKKRLLSAK